MTRLNKLHVSNVERIDAVDGAATDISTDLVTLRWDTTRNWGYVTKVFEGGQDCGYTQKQLDLTPGERGCAASHIALWRRCVSAVGPTLVLEDDAKPSARFSDAVAQALQDVAGESPDILYLGYTQAAPWRRKVSASVREAEYLWTTVAYVLWPSGAAKLLHALPVDQPVDNYMSILMAAGTLRGFAIVPEVVKQAKPWNIDNDVAHSDDKAWLQNCVDSRG